MSVSACSLVLADAPLLGRLRNRGIKLTRSSTNNLVVVYFDHEHFNERLEMTEDQIVRRWTIPEATEDDLDQVSLEIVASERGGCGSGQSSATVVCLPNGRSITPYMIRVKDDHVTAVRFSHPGPLVTVTVQADATNVEEAREAVEVDAWLHELSRHGPEVALASSRLTVDGPDTPIENIGKLDRAIQGALQRLVCGGCRQSHYAAAKPK